MRAARKAPEEKSYKTALEALLAKRAQKAEAHLPRPASPGFPDDSEEDSNYEAKQRPPGRYDYSGNNTKSSIKYEDGGVDSLTKGLQSLGLNKERATHSLDDYTRSDASEASASESDSGDEANAAPQPTAPQRSSGNLQNLVLGPSKEFVLDGAVSSKLYPHQVIGVEWLYKIYKAGKGGILGDDMGLGKTMQCAAFIAGLIQSKLAKSIIIVAPKTLLAHWEKELSVCKVASYIVDFAGGSEGARADALRRVATRTSIMLTTYGMIQHNYERLKSPGNSRYHDEEFSWDLMILDEGHKIKNPKMQLYKRFQEIPVKVAVIISGTPIQNNLAELWALYNFCTPDLLGTKSWFKTQFENLITQGQDKDATAYMRQRGAAKAAELRQLIEPYFLRREKNKVLTGSSANAEGEAEGQAGPSQPKPQAMPHKNDFIVWLSPKPLQQSVYQAYLCSSAVKAALDKTGHVLAAITILKKICDHPALLSKRAAKMVMTGARKWAVKGAVLLSDSEDEESEESESEDDLSDFIVDDDISDDEWERRKAAKKKQKEAARNRRNKVALDQEWEELDEDVESKILKHLEDAHEKGADASCKTAFVLTLLDQLKAEGHRTLVFSQSRVMLDIIQAGIKEKGMRFCRIDGTMAKPGDRQREVDTFQKCKDIPVFLLTSQVGGLGLTITAADRVVIVDPAWNPAVDNQSVDRAYRIGQTRDVVVYRLITCGTVEEKIYRRQVSKTGLFRTGVEEGVQYRYFSQQEIRDLFEWDPEWIDKSKTQQDLHQLHARQRKASQEVKDHLKFLDTLDGFAGVSDHDLMFSKKSEDEPLDLLPPELLATAPKPSETMAAAGSTSVDALMSQMQGMKLGGPKPAPAPMSAVDLELKKIRHQKDMAKFEVQKYEGYLNGSSPAFSLDEAGRNKIMRKLEECGERLANLTAQERKILSSKESSGQKLKDLTNVPGSLPFTMDAAAAKPSKPQPTSHHTSNLEPQALPRRVPQPIPNPAQQQATHHAPSQQAPQPTAQFAPSYQVPQPAPAQSFQASQPALERSNGTQKPASMQPASTVSYRSYQAPTPASMQSAPTGSYRSHQDPTPASIQPASTGSYRSHQDPTPASIQPASTGPYRSHQPPNPASIQRPSTGFYQSDQPPNPASMQPASTASYRSDQSQPASTGSFQARHPAPAQFFQAPARSHQSASSAAAPPSHQSAQRAASYQVPSISGDSSAYSGSVGSGSLQAPRYPAWNLTGNSSEFSGGDGGAGSFQAPKYQVPAFSGDSSKYSGSGGSQSFHSVDSQRNSGSGGSSFSNGQGNPFSPPAPRTLQFDSPGDQVGGGWACVRCTYKHLGKEAGFLTCNMCGLSRSDSHV